MPGARRCDRLRVVRVPGGFGGECLEDPSPNVGRRRPIHASPPGEDEERRPWRTVLDFGLAASPKQPPSPQPSPSRAREKERRLTRAFAPGPSRVVAGMGARKSLAGFRRRWPNPGPSPPNRVRGRLGQVLPLPQERVKIRPAVEIEAGFCRCLSREREKERLRLRGRGGVLQRSPLGEGEERPRRRGRVGLCKGLRGMGRRGSWTAVCVSMSKGRRSALRVSADDRQA